MYRLMKRFRTEFRIVDTETSDYIYYEQDEILAENIHYAEAICNAIGSLVI